MKTYILMLLTACLLSGCLKTENILDYRGIDAIVMNPKSNFPAKTAFATKLTDSAFGITQLNLTAKYAFQMPAPHDIKVTFTKDEAMMAKYNQDFGTDYLPLPSDSYEMPASQALIPAGSQQGVLSIKVLPAKISGTKNYIIAFTISNADGLNIAENFKGMVFTLKGNNLTLPPVVLPPVVSPPGTLPPVLGPPVVAPPLGTGTPVVIGTPGI